MRRPLFFLAMCCLVLSNAMVRAQETAGQETAAAEAAQESAPSAQPFFSKSVGLHLGTQGLGIQGQMPVLPFLNARLGASILPLKANTIKTIGREETDLDLASTFMNAHLLADLQMFPKAQSVLNRFVFTLGAGYFFAAKGEADAMLNNGYTYGDIQFTPEEVGVVNAKVDWKGFAPFAGLGFNNVRINDLVNFNVGLGTYYLTSPSVKVVGTNMLKGNSINEAPLKNNLKDYRFLPVLQFSFNYSLFK